MAIETIQELTLNRWLAVAMPNERIFGLYLLVAVIMAFLSWLYYRKLEKTERPEKTDKSFGAYLLDKDIFLHKSAIQDYIYFFVNGLIYIGIISQLLLSTHFFTSMFHGGLQNMFGIQEAPVLEASALTIVLYTAVYVLLLDFAVFIVHYALHKVPVLWEFHKVHHSAEVLNPMTLYRMHPIDLFLTSLLAALLVSFAYAGFYYLTGEPPAPYEIMGVNIVVFAFYLLGYNLRHSHIWLNYPRWLSAILISPAQHQIHHSTAPKHFDKNMGLIFSVWDKMFKTLYVPAKYEKISYGINEDKPNPFNNVWDMYFQPFKNVWKIIRPDSKANRAALIFLLITAFFAFNYIIFLALDRTLQADKAPPASVYMEELTWTEVQRAMDKFGYDTVIIPAGGTEQNGAHMVLGKHNIIVRHNAGKIAKRLGHTFVAPVISYVPEEVHMEYAGTISVPEYIFEGVLEAAAMSYIEHSFKNILFIGDSVGNQDAQERVAQRLSERRENITIAHIGDYYDNNGQYDWLIEQGYTREQIGGHAGIRDTAEMMYIHPEGLHTAPYYIQDRDTGHNGDPTLATKRIGKIMTEMKVNAALKQIRKVLGNHPESKPEDTGPSNPYH